MTHPSLATSLDDLRSRVRGPVIEPNDAEYDEGRAGWNALIDRRPGAIVRCLGVADVIASVNFARDHDILLAIRSGGHDYAGNSACDGGLVIDLSAMNGIRIDPGAKRAVVQAGATVGAFDHEAQAFGLATPTGTVSTVGVGGLTLGGGSGYLTPRHGLTVDNLLAADVVTAAGERVHASADEHPDLFWAIRGGGGNFGVATAFEFALHEVGPELLAGQIVHRFEDAGDVMRFYRSFMAGAPEALQCYPFFLKLPPLDVFPEELHGQLAIDLVLAYAGPLDEAEEVLKPLQEFGNPVFAGLAPQPYTAIQQGFDAGMPKGNRWYSKAGYLPEDLPDEAIEMMLEHVATMPGPFSVTYLEAVRGAVTRVAPNTTAYPHRSPGYGIHIFPGWTDPALDDQAKQWARRFHEAMMPWLSRGAYVNLLPPDAGPDEVRAAYGPNYERLVRIKKAYDPANLFRMNHNIGTG